MKAPIYILSAALLLVVFGVAYTADGTDEPENQIDDRWYTESQLRLGKNVFENNCMVCHGSQGQGLADDWKQPLADGSYPPPPLNGKAHTWHHPVSQLMWTINNGGIPPGGKMPAFGATLSDQEKIAVVAYFQNWWPDDIYEAWIERGGLEN